MWSNDRGMLTTQTPAGRRGRRPRVFTEYVESLGTTGDPPDQKSFDRVWNALQTALRTELRVRGLWTSPPRYLGVVGSDRWDEETLDELTTDAYVFNFVHRLRSLRAQLEVKPNIEGLVLLNLKNFLYERQRRHDPLGSRLFQTLRSALRGLVEDGALEVSRGASEIRNETVLRFARPPSTPTADDLTGPSPAPSLQELTATWGDDLLPELVTARGGRYDVVTASLGRRIAGLRDRGCQRFTFKELADPLKTAVRERWRALHTYAGEDAGEGGAPQGDEAFGTVRRIARPDEELEDAEAFEKVTDCVERRMDRLDTDERTGEYLSNLWQFLRIHAAGERDLPSRRKLAERLEIPRNRFPELYGTLGELLEACRKLLLEPPRPRTSQRKGGAP